MNLPCRFSRIGCQSPATVILYVPEGCHCWKDPVQALCDQHYITAESPGPIMVLADLTDPSKGLLEI